MKQSFALLALLAALFGAAATPAQAQTTPPPERFLTLTWRDNSANEIGFEIERATSAAGPWLKIGEVGADVTTYRDTGLTAGTGFWYRVCAYNGGGRSEWSNVATATTAPLPPTAPSGLQVSVAQIVAAAVALLGLVFGLFGRGKGGAR